MSATTKAAQPYIPKAGECRDSKHVELERINKELLEVCEKMLWFLSSEAHEWTYVEQEKLEAAIAHATEH